MGKIQQFKNRPTTGAYGQYYYESNSDTFDDFLQSDAIQKPTDRFVDKTLQTEVVSDYTRDYVIDNQLPLIGSSYIKINKISIDNRGVNHKVKNTHFRGFIFDKNTFDCFDTSGNLKSYNDIDKALYKDGVEVVTSAAGESVTKENIRLFNFTTFFDFNAPRYGKKKGPGELLFLTDVNILSNLSMGDDFETSEHSYNSTFNTSMENFDERAYTIGDIYPQPFNPQDGVVGNNRTTRILSENGDDNYIQVVIWMRGDARRFAGTKRRRKGIAVLKISPSELLQGTGNPLEGLEARFTNQDIPTVYGGGGTTPAWKVSDLSLTISTVQGENIDNYISLDQDVVLSVTQPRIINNDNFDFEFFDVTTLNSIHDYTNGYRVNFTPTAEVKIKNTEFNLQGFKTNILERQICSAPNNVELNINISKAIIEDDSDIILEKLNPNDGNAPPLYKYCVVDWNDENDTFNTVDDVFENKPTDIDTLLKAQENNTYIFKEVNEKLYNSYNTPGIKVIKVLIFNYEPLDANIGEIGNYKKTPPFDKFQIYRYKLMKIRIFLDIPISKFPDFGEVGGDDYVTLPWPYTAPIIGGLDNSSNYKLSALETLGGGNIGENDIIDELFLQNDLRNMETGKSIQSMDLEQVRYYTNGSYDLNKLLGLVYDNELIGERVYLVTDAHLQTLNGYYGGGILPGDVSMTEAELDLNTNDGEITEQDIQGWINYGRPDIADFINQQYFGGVNTIFAHLPEGWSTVDYGGGGAAGEPSWAGFVPPIGNILISGTPGGGEINPSEGAEEETGTGPTFVDPDWEGSGLVDPNDIGTDPGGGTGQNIYDYGEADALQADVIAFNLAGDFIPGSPNLRQLLTIRHTNEYQWGTSIPGISPHSYLRLINFVFSDRNSMAIPMTYSNAQFEGFLDEDVFEGEDNVLIFSPPQFSANGAPFGPPGEPGTGVPGWYSTLFFKCSSDIQGYQFQLGGDILLDASGYFSESDILDIQVTDNSAYQLEYNSVGDAINHQDGIEIYSVGVTSNPPIYNLDFVQLPDGITIGSQLRINFVKEEDVFDSAGYTVQLLRYSEGSGFPSPPGTEPNPGLTSVTKYTLPGQYGAQPARNNQGNIISNLHKTIRVMITDDFPAGTYKIKVLQNIYVNPSTGVKVFGSVDTFPKQTLTYDSEGVPISTSIEFIIPPVENLGTLVTGTEEYENQLFVWNYDDYDLNNNVNNIPDGITNIIQPGTDVIAGESATLLPNGQWVGSLDKLTNGFSYLFNNITDDNLIWTIGLNNPDDLTNDITYVTFIPDEEEAEIEDRPLDAFENPIYYVLNQDLPNPYTDVSFWTGEINYFPHNSSVGKIFINDIDNLEQKKDCKLELNLGNLIGKSIYDSSGNSNKGLLIGDYKLIKVRKGEDMRRDSFIKVPKKTSNKNGAL